MTNVFRALVLTAIVCSHPALDRSGITVGRPKGSEPGRLAAPITYENLLLVFASDDGVAAVVFTDKLDKGITYRFRYESKDGKKQTGTGKLFEKYKPVEGSPGQIMDDGGELWFKVGPFDIEWSVRGEGGGWIYYVPEKVRVQIAHASDFDKLNLKRFAR